MRNLQADAHRIASEIVALSESLRGDSEEIESASIDLLNLSVAFSSVAFMARTLTNGERQESESVIRKELLYEDLHSTYEKVRSLYEKRYWIEVGALCQAECSRIQGLAQKLLA